MSLATLGKPRGAQACGDGSRPAKFPTGSSQWRKRAASPSSSTASSSDFAHQRPRRRVVSRLLMLTISIDPGLRLQGRLLYDAVNPAGGRRAVFEGSDQGRSKTGARPVSTLLPGAVWARPTC